LLLIIYQEPYGNNDMKKSPKTVCSPTSTKVTAVCIEVPLVLVERRNINLDPWVKIDSCLISLHRLLLEACAFTYLVPLLWIALYSLKTG
jgi:hypothetical protein